MRPPDAMCAVPTAHRIDLNFLDLPTIIQNLAENNRTGVLKVTSGKRMRGIRFDDGKIRMVIDPENRRFLVDALVRSRALRREQLDGLGDHITADASLAQQLLDRGVVDGQKLNAAFSFYITESVCGVFGWPNIECEFLQGEPSAPWVGGDLDWQAAVAANRVLFEAARRQDELQAIREKVASAADIPVVASQAQAQADSAEACVLPYISEMRDVGEIVEQVPLSRFEAMKALFELIQRGTIRMLTVDEMVRTAADLARHCPSLDPKQSVAKLIRIYERAEELGYSGRELNVWLGRAYEQAGRNEEAAARYLKIGRGLIAEKKGEEALERLRQAARLAVLDLEGRKLHVEAHLLVGNKDQAATIGGTIIEDLQTSGKADEAYAYARRMKQVVPGSIVLLRLTAELELERGDRIQAICDFDDLAALYIEQQNWQRAAEIYHRILSLDEENIEAHYRLAMSLQRLGKLDEAVRRYKMLADMLSSSELKDTINWSFLIRIYEKVTEIEKDNVIAREWLADAYTKRNDLDRALGHLQAIVDVLRHRPQHDSLKSALKKILGLQALDFPARQLLAEILTTRAEKNEAIHEYVSLAWVAMTEGEGGIAKTALAKAAQLDPLSPEVHQGSARYYDRLGDPVAAARSYRDVGYLHRAAGRLAESEIAFRQAAKFDDRYYFWLFELGETARHKGANDDALRLYKELAEHAHRLADFGAVKMGCEAAMALGVGEQEWAEDLLAQALSAQASVDED